MAGDRLEDLGRRRARIAAGEAGAGAGRAVRDGFVAGEEEGAFHGAQSIAEIAVAEEPRSGTPNSGRMSAYRAGAAHTSRRSEDR